MGRSLFLDEITTATPGVVWLDSFPVDRTVQSDDDIFMRIVRFDVPAIQSEEQIDTDYIVGGDEAYVGSLSAFFDDGKNNYSFRVELSSAFDSTGSTPGPEFTAAAKTALGFAYQDADGNNGKLDLTNFFVVDMTDPYRADDQSGNDIATFAAQIIAAFTDAEQGKFLLVDRNHANIDFDTLQTVDAPLAPAAPTLTATATSIEVTLTDDPTSDADITKPRRSLPHWQRSLDGSR